MARRMVLSVLTLLYSILPIYYAQRMCHVWTRWMDDENGGTLDPASIGEFELVKQLRKTHRFCGETTDIECALADDTHTPYSQTGQVSLTCSQQIGDCFNYAIRLLCAVPLKEDSKHVCVESDGISFKFTCTFLDGWTDDLGNKSSCQHSNAIVDISDVIYGIFNASSVANVIDCTLRPLLSKADGSEDALVVKIKVFFSKDAELTEDKVITAFREAATRRNQDAFFNFRVDTDSVRVIMVNRNQSEYDRKVGQFSHKSMMTTVPPSPSNTGTIVLVVSLVVLILIAALAGTIFSNFCYRRNYKERGEIDINSDCPKECVACP